MLCWQFLQAGRGMLATCLQHFSPWFLAAQSLQKVPGFLCKIPFQDHIVTSMSALSPLCILFRVNAPLLFWWSRTPMDQFSERFSRAQSGFLLDLVFPLTWNSLQGERTLLWNRREFSVHLQTSLELLLMGRRQPGFFIRNFPVFHNLESVVSFYCIELSPKDVYCCVWRPTWDKTSLTQMFVRGTSCELTVGAGDGRFGIWLDSNLNQVPIQSNHQQVSDQCVRERSL